MLGGWEIVIIFAVILVLFMASSGALPIDFKRGFKKGIEEFGKAVGDVAGELDVERPSRSAWSPLVVWLAVGFGVGRIPFAPGTFGSLLGMLWFAILLSTQTIWGFVGGMFGGVMASVWICGKAERILNQRDPGSIVMDEICAVPICFVPWVVSEWLRKGAWPPLETFFGAKTWYVAAIIFVLFRIFDILKPPPVRQSQRLPGGWGVVTDDVLAALYVCALSLIVFH